MSKEENNEPERNKVERNKLARNKVERPAAEWVAGQLDEVGIDIAYSAATAIGWVELLILPRTTLCCARGPLP